MTDSSKLTPAMRGMECLKVYVPQGTAHNIRQQAQALGIPVSAHLSPVVVAVGSGQLAASYAYAAPPPAAAISVLPGVAERIHALPRLSAACRALLALVCQEYEQTGGDRTDATNAELGQALRVHGITVARAVTQLQVGGWLHVRLYANGANGRQLWPSEKARAVYGAR
jgi:hypothetical protein